MSALPAPPKHKSGNEDVKEEEDGDDGDDFFDVVSKIIYIIEK